MNRSFSTPAVVLKRSNVGESDRIVTLLTKSEGKVTCVAKGVRKMSSSNRATIEPGNLITAFLIPTKGLSILTQTKLQHDFAHTKTSLPRLRQLTQILEMADRLFMENVEEATLFDEIVAMLHNLNSAQPKLGLMKQQLESLIAQLGYQTLAESGHANFMDYIAELTDKPMRSWEYLRVK